ncbi:MAG: hypothetical protein LBS11_10245 [Oscillospiraceae bacterium]|jgi:xylulokinase|nr:hypothetical protein [Oscillospiraceae bacterium]
MLLMGLDVGTTSVKAAVFDCEGRQISLASARTRVSFPAPGQAEQEASRVWAALLSVTREAALASGGEPIAAMSLSTQGDAVVPVDGNGQALSLFHLGMDYRCQPHAEAFANEFGGYELFRRTGMRPHAINTLCKIRCIRETMPEIRQNAAAYRTYTDYLLALLGAEQAVIDLTMASRTMAMAVNDTVWDGELVEAAGIKPGQLSKPVASGTVVGQLSRSAAESIGAPCALSEQTLLVAGAHDQVCAAVGAGVVRPGMALDSHGTAEVVSRVLDTPCLTRAMYGAGFPCYRFAGEGRWFTFSLNHAAGLLLRHFAGTYCAEERARADVSGEDLFDLILGGAASKPTNLIILPYLNGRGTPINDQGLTGLIAGLTLSTSRAEIARAILESLAYDMLANLDAAEAAGFHTSSLRCVGGGARGRLNLSIKADVTGREAVTLAHPEAACFGAALLAGIGAKAFDSVDDAARLARVRNIIQPDPQRHAYYSGRYELFNQFYERSHDLLKQAAVR